MPHKQKKHPNALKDGSPRVEKNNLAPVSPPVASPAPAPTNYREIHQNEVEALRSIYGDDFEEIEHRRSAWQVRIYTFRILDICTNSVAIVEYHL